MSQGKEVAIFSLGQGLVSYSREWAYPLFLQRKPHWNTNNTTHPLVFHAKVVPRETM